VPTMMNTNSCSTCLRQLATSALGRQHPFAVDKAAAQVVWRTATQPVGGLRRIKGRRGCLGAGHVAQRCKLACNPALAQIVAGKLQSQWSPEQIAGWLKRTTRAKRICRCLTKPSIARSSSKHAEP
jgi:hypothetical protein